MKHAVITCSNGVFQIVDLCSNDTEIKTDDSCFEPLDPMKIYKLNNLDVIRFGRQFCVTFHKLGLDNVDIVESSQLTLKFNSEHNTSINNIPKFFVPSTEGLTQNIESQAESLSQLIDIPETQYDTRLPNELKSGLNSSDSNLSSGVVINVVSEIENINEENEQFSQNIFAEISINKSQQEIEEVDDELDNIENFALIKAKAHKNALTPDLISVRDGSITPELDFKSKLLCQSDIVTQVNPNVQTPIKMEQESQQRILQGDIETQVYCPDKNYNSRMLEMTQPLLPMNIRTRLAIKRQELIKPRTIPLSEFEESPPPKNLRTSCFVMETQPVIVEATQKNEKQKLGTKIVNRILISSDEESDEESEEEDSNMISHDSTSTIYLENTLQNPVINIQRDSPITPLRMTDSPLIFDVSTPDFVPKLPSDSQLEVYLDFINSSQQVKRASTNVVVDLLNENGANVERREPSKKELKSNMPVKKHRHRLMKYDSDSEDDNLPPIKNVKAKVVKYENKKKATSNKASSPKLATRDEIRNNVTLRSKRPIKEKSDDEPSAKVFKPSNNNKKGLKPIKFYAVAMTNIKETLLEQMCMETMACLGGKTVDRIQDADLLVSNDKIKMTSKFLGAVCRGIPIVGRAFIEASRKAGTWVNPKDYIIIDKAFEAKKELSLKTQLEKISLNPSKLFSKYSVIVTSGTVVPFEEMRDIIENGGGECLGIAGKPRHENLLLVFSSKSHNERKEVIKKYPKIIQIKDTYFGSSVMQQIIQNRM